MTIDSREVAAAWNGLPRPALLGRIASLEAEVARLRAMLSALDYEYDPESVGAPLGMAAKRKEGTTAPQDPVPQELEGLNIPGLRVKRHRLPGSTAMTKGMVRSLIDTIVALRGKS